MADKLRNQQELERLQAKYVGTGHPDTTSWEWKTNIYRDTYSSIAGHPPMLSYMALAENEPTQLLRARLIRVFLNSPGSTFVDMMANQLPIENDATCRPTTST
ncbi:Uncharacterized protein CTA2_11260 [Colletotrichum tanaceti]|uniref:Splicing factor subunit n=1 Tax=Colletotrichum tanaceti TaxID=1306861 RepID=A0A4U6XGJ9_9PEZI|nr:Uncharacterized protein CTA2_11260 [Colletotrichum tanaceti]TKW54392.1 Uncharacterized protein CTA1_4048 [Colletotrichum tanaceti]